MGFWESKRIKKTRKSHRCEYCGAKIPEGSSCHNEVGVYGGDFNNYYLCDRCYVFMDLYRDDSESELGSFVDDLFNSDLLECPVCRKSNLRDYDFINNIQSIEIECDNCDHKWTVDLSLERFQAIKQPKVS